MSKTRKKVKKDGRPRKKEEERRDIPFTVKLNKKEKRKVEQRAQQTQLPERVWFRRAALNRRQPTPPKKLPKVNVKTYNELRKIGVNLNQIAKRLNESKLFTKARYNEEQLEKLEELLHQISMQIAEQQ